jgi:hypothetical protein
VGLQLDRHPFVSQCELDDPGEFPLSPVDVDAGRLDGVGVVAKPGERT